MLSRKYILDTVINKSNDYRKGTIREILIEVTE